MPSTIRKLTTDDTRPTKRAKKTWPLTLTAFEAIWQAILDFQDHKKRFTPIMFQLCVLPLYQPLYAEYGNQHHDLNYHLQCPVDDDVFDDFAFCEWDIRKMKTTRQTRLFQKRVKEMFDHSEDDDDCLGSFFYYPAKTIKLNK